MAQAPRAKLRSRRTLVTLAGAVVAALVVWRLLPNQPQPKPSPSPDTGPSPEPNKPAG